MTSVHGQCHAFGSIVDDIQECKDAEQLRQLFTKGLTSLLVIRNLGFKLFDVTEQCKSDAESARKAFDDKKLVLQNMLYENGYYQKEINEARNYRSSVSDADMELLSTENFFQAASPEFYSDLDKSEADCEHLLLLKRLEHELHSRKQARQQLNELRARRDAMHATLGLKRKAVDDLSEHVTQIKAAAAPVRQLLPQAAAAAPPEQQQLAQLLPLPLYMIFSQITATSQLLTAPVDLSVHGSVDTAQEELSAAVKAATPAAGNKRQKREGSPEPTTETDYRKMFPLSVELQVKETGLSFTFYYLPVLGIVTVEASTKAGNALLATLFRGDTGKDTPSEANHYIDEGSYDFPSDVKARPYRWAQWLAGLDFLPTLPAGLVLQKDSHHSAVQQGLKQYRREKRALHVMRTLVQRAENVQGLQAELAQLLSKTIPLSFPNRHFQQLPAGSISLQEIEQQQAQALPKIAQAVPDADEDEEGEVQDAQVTEHAEGGEAAPDNMQVDDEVKEEDGLGDALSKAPVPLVNASNVETRQGSALEPEQDFSGGYRFLKMHLKSSTGWQLDGQIRVHGLYPNVTPQVSITSIKESFRPSVTKRQELSAEQVSALQTEVQKFATELDTEERQQVLSYQVAFLLRALHEQTVARKAADPQPSRPVSRPPSAAAEHSQHGTGTYRGRAPVR